MQMRRAVEADRRRLADFAASLQIRPERHVIYLGLDGPSIAEELVAEDEDWTSVTSVIEEEADDGDGGRLVGWLMGSVDADMGRVWWFGPFIDVPSDDAWAPLADVLYDDARSLLPAGVDKEEFSIDSRFTALADWARQRGCVADPGSAVLVLDGDLPPPTVPTRPVTPDDVATVGPLHDRLFAGTHTTGASLVAGVDENHLRLVAERDGRVVGYIAVETQPDGGGYIDFVGVTESLRGQGLGAELIRAGVAALRQRGCRRVTLTVRVDNAAARALYARLGFVEERLAQPFRRGFSLG